MTSLLLLRRIPAAVRPSFVLNRRCLCVSVQDPKQFTSGIEHADALKAVGVKQKLSWNMYKVPEYHQNNKYTYYDLETELTPFRAYRKQADPRVPDAEPKVTAAVEQKSKKK